MHKCAALRRDTETPGLVPEPGVRWMNEAVLGQVRQRLARMRFGIHIFVSLEHLPVGPDQHGNPRGALLIGALRRAIGQGYRAVGVAQQFGGEADLVAPAFQILARTEGNAQQDGVLIGIFLGSSTEPIGFLGSIVAEGARKEPDQHVASRIIRQTYAVAVLARQRKGRRSTSYFR